MTSSDARDVIVDAKRVGRVRVLEMKAASALYPRLEIILALDLNEISEDGFAPNRPIKDYELRALSGELRLQERSGAVGPVYWAGNRWHIRSVPYPDESPITMMCDLNAETLEGIEDKRAGGPAVFWLELWPSLVDKQGFLDASIDPLRTVVSIEEWLKVLDIFKQQSHSLLGISFPAVAASRYEAALTHLRTAQGKSSTGDYDDAVAACRRALETLAKGENIRFDVSALIEFLEPRTDKKRAENYGKIFATIKNLGNSAVHRPDATLRFCRADAQFVIGITGHLIALCGALQSDHRT